MAAARFGLIVALSVLAPRQAHQTATESSSGDASTPECDWGNRDDFCGRFGSDGECDDGGPGSDHSVCPYGTDYTDCGARPGCGNQTYYCIYQEDSHCDDGGMGAEYAACLYGTDSDDCGLRPPRPPSLPPLPPLSPIMSEQDRCDHHSMMLGISWAFAVLWVVILVLWILVMVFSCCGPAQICPPEQPQWDPHGQTAAPRDVLPGTAASATADPGSPRVEGVVDGVPAQAPADGGEPPPQCKCLLMQWMLFVVPTFHLADAGFQVWQYNFCECMVCTFGSRSDIFTYYTVQAIFDLGRLSALLFCLYVLSTGAGTVRKWIRPCDAIVLFLLWGGFITTVYLGLPLTVYAHGTHSMSAFWASIVMYALLFLAIQVGAFLNLRVLKAQLMMIRVQGIDPKTCPAYAKFRLFVGLRRWVWIYFILHTFVIFLQFFEDMALWGQVVLFILWEIAQLVVTFLIGWLFKATGKTNLYLEREAHLPEEQVARHFDASEVTLALDELDMIADERPGGDMNASLLTWRPSTAVPAPPAPPAVIEIFRPTARTRRRRTRPSPSITTPTSSGSTPMSSDPARCATEMAAMPRAAVAGASAGASPAADKDPAPYVV